MNPTKLCLPKTDNDNKSSTFNQPRNKVSPKVTRSNLLNHNPIPKKHNKAVYARNNKGQNGHAVETGKTRDMKKETLKLEDHSVWTLKVSQKGQIKTITKNVISLPQWKTYKIF